jgi:hypothetical protein
VFVALEKVGMVVEFIVIVKLMFQDVEVAININGRIIKAFKIKKGIK